MTGSLHGARQPRLRPKTHGWVLPVQDPTEHDPSGHDPSGHDPNDCDESTDRDGRIQHEKTEENRA